LPTATFLQIADLHLGAPFGWLPPAQRRTRQSEQRLALESAIAAAIERRADAILVAGDLFDRDAVSAETIAFAVHAFAAPGCPPVFIAPGNHDPWSASSPCWSARLLGARGFAWPDHVHVFASAEWAAREVPGLPIRVWGRCFSSGIATFARPLDSGALAGVSASGPGTIDVAVFHGSREGHRPPLQKITAPFSDDEARRAPFAYLAVGHYHVAQRLDEAGSVRLAYSGSPVAVDATEVGAHGALEVRLSFGEGAPRVEVEPLVLDARRVHDLEVDVTGAPTNEAIEARIARALGDAGVGADDLVTLRLTGRLARGARFAAPSAALEAQAFFIRVDRRAARPDHDLDGYRARPPSTTEERFAHTLLERLEHAVDPEERRVVECALYYGLDAFRLREVVPAYEDLDT
jgi:DNA repair protein SbcD/Mre11